MKNFIKGFLSCFTLLLIGIAIPSFAENANVILGGIRININGIDRANWNESILLDNANEIPYSITYNDTTYLPFRKIGELNNKKIYWNGDTQTASMTDIPTVNSEREITRQPDANGNIWTYYTFSTLEGKYIGIKDELRGYERVYRIVGQSLAANEEERAVGVDSDGILFFKLLTNKTSANTPTAILYKIYFNNDINHQDGEIIKNYNDGYADFLKYAFFDGDYVYCVKSVPGNGARDFFEILHLTDWKRNQLYLDKWTSASNVHLQEGPEDNVQLNYYWDTNTGPTFQCSVKILKGEEFSFGEPEIHGKITE